MPTLREYDLISGLTGIGVYLLHHQGEGELLREVLSYLVRLVVEPLTVDGEMLPGWWTGNGPADQPSRDWSGGHGNLGLAHGIAGPLALLASAMTRGITVTGHAEAIERTCAWLDQWRCGTRARSWWPGMISPPEWKTRTVRQTGPQRPSWCYGTPGLARAQQLAALALGDARPQRRAEEALAGCIADDTQLAQLGDAWICHGWAGLVQTTRRAAADAGADSELAALLPRLHAGFEQHLHRQQPPAQDGMLDGAAGIALTRQSTVVHAPHASRWDACLLIAPPTLERMHTEGNGMTTTTDTQPEDLRNRMVDHILAAGHLHSSRIEQVLRTVPRHLFVPEADIENAYANRHVTTKPGSNGRPASCASQPTVVAMMLGQLDARPGDRVLEIGAGTGYNAALLAELVGETGEVTTIDIDPEVTAQARHALDATGYGRVHVTTGDGALGAADRAPFDRIIVTVGPWDLPPAWWDQLAPGGRLVVPLRWRGQARSVAFTRGQGFLRAEDSQLCGFIPMIGQDGERTGHIDTGVALHWDADQSIDPAALTGVLAQPKTAVWSGATVSAGESFDGVWLRLTGTERGTCRIAAEPAAIDSRLCTPAIPSRSPALVEGASLAYFTLRGLNHDTERRWELGAIGHGPAGPQLADRLCEQIRAWDRDRTAQPLIAACPAGTPDEELPDGLVIDKRHIRLVISC